MAQELNSPHVLIVGNEGGTNVGASLHRAAGALGLSAEIVNAYHAYEGLRLATKFNWWVRGRRPTRLKAFSKSVVQACREHRPTWLVATGFAPLTRAALDEIRALEIQTINYLTDDPWNDGGRRKWFLEALVAYDQVFSTRRQNLSDLERLGCRSVAFLPFGFDPLLFFPDPPSSPSEASRYSADVFFAGGADSDRIPYLAALIDARCTVSLYGDYWERFRETAPISRGHAPPDVLRKAITGASICLCLVRRSNRDGHSMRSFEVPAAGGCMLVEHTAEHEEFFGPEGEAVVYFRSISEMVAAARRLLPDPDTRDRLAAAAHRLIAGGSFTYCHRMSAMLGLSRVY